MGPAMRAWETRRIDGWGADLSGYLGLALGTPFTRAGTGLTLRRLAHIQQPEQDSRY